MSTYGGDSWVPENLYRKRRVAELLGEEIDEDEVRLLSNGRLVCLVCSNRPVVDTMPMLHIHRKGARHLAAAENLREKKRSLHHEIQKRIALGSEAVPSTGSSSISDPEICISRKRISPLLTATTNIKNAVLLGQLDGDSEAAKPPGNVLSTSEEVHPYVSKRSGLFFQNRTENPASTKIDIPASSKSLLLKADAVGSKGVVKSSSSQKRKNSERRPVELENDLAMQELRRQAQRELKWKEAGWRRDSSGRWSRDENVEFDSDEEVPVDGI